MTFKQRIQAFNVGHPMSMNKTLDQYLSEHLPDMIDQYKLADRSDMADLEKVFLSYEERMEALENWKGDFDEKLKKDQARMDRLKFKVGIKQR